MKGIATLAVLLVVSAACAQFTATNPGPINSDGVLGDAVNQGFTFNYAGADFTPNTVRFQGDLTNVHASSYLTEARWQITNPAAQAGSIQPFASGTTWVGTQHADQTFSGLPGVFSGTSVGTWNFLAYEGYDDGGNGSVDATWSNVSFEFTAAGVWTNTNYFAEAPFLAAIQANYYLEDYSSYVYGSPLDGNQLTQAYGPVNGFGYTASAPQGLWSNDSSLSTNNAGDALLITFDPAANPVTAVGGNLVATDINGNLLAGTVTITMENGATWSLSNQTAADFFGFTASSPIVSVAFDAVDGDLNRWIQLDHFYVGQAIPEPASLALLGLAALLLRRR